MHITQNSLGFDIGSVVNQLVKARAQPIQRIQDQNSQIENKISAWNEAETKISDLRSSLDTVTGYSMWGKNKAEVTTSSVEDMMSASAATNAATGTYDFEVSQLAQSHKVAGASAADITGNPDADASTELGLEGEFTIGGETISVATSDSLSNIRNTINNAAANMADSEKVQANIIDNRLVLRREQTGSTDISIDEAPDNGTDEPILGSGGLDIWSTASGFHHENQSGQDLNLTVDGMSVTRSSNTDITDIIEGVTLNFDKTGTATLDVGTDVESMKSKIEEFVSAYNDAMSEAEKKTAVTISNDNVETSSLHGSSLLRNFQTKSRDVITSSDPDLNSDFDGLRKIGIYTSSRSNRLEITDTEALEEALRNNPDEVEALFRESDDGGVKAMSNYVDSVAQIGGAIDSRVDNLNDRISRNDERIEDQQRRLQKYEERLWRKYSRLDSMASEMQQMTSYVNGMIG